MSATPERIWASRKDHDVRYWTGENELVQASHFVGQYILATPAALASSPEVAAIVAEAVAKMQRSRDRYRKAWEDEKRRATAAAALRTGETG